MKINRDNYEAYFLDYHEGTLTPEEMAEVLVFVGQNPDLKEEFEEFENISLPTDESINFAGKDFLKVNAGIYAGPVTLNNIEEYLVAEAEGLLSDEMLARLDEFVMQNPGFEKDRRIYRHTRLEADSQIVYARKDSLKHNSFPVGEINETNYEEYLVKEVEGILTPDEADDLEIFVGMNPQARIDRKLFGMTKLQPDTSIMYTAKASLKHTVVPFRRIVYYSMSAAASVVVLLGLYFTFDLNRTSNQTALSEVSFSRQAVVPDLPAEVYHELAAIEGSDASSPVMSDQINIKNPVQSDNRSNNQENVPQRSMMASMDMRVQSEVSSKQQVAPEFLFIRQSQLYGSRYIDLYNSVKLSEQMQYAELNAQDKNPIGTLWRGLRGKVEERIVDDQRTVSQPPQGLSIWTVAEAGVKAYNSISHDDLELLLQKDETGKVVSYALVGDKVNFERNVK
jgi:hypothetical protein